jgi:hypothetical protein
VNAGNGQTSGVAAMIAAKSGRDASRRAGRRIGKRIDRPLAQAHPRGADRDGNNTRSRDAPAIGIDPNQMFQVMIA